MELSYTTEGHITYKTNGLESETHDVCALSGYYDEVVNIILSSTRPKWSPVMHYEDRFQIFVN